ncbi:MAG: hypothetical protein Kow0080_35400 [Candidatus Promineifilaceae bacterium]
MPHTPLFQQLETLPSLVEQMVPALVDAIADALPAETAVSINRVFLTGCGDSYHAPVNAELAFELLAGVPCEPMTAMQFARYAVPFLPAGKQTLVTAVSVSGAVSRTIEALRLSRHKQVTTAAITGNRSTPLAKEAAIVIEAAVPPLPDELQGIIVPGARSYFASQLALYLLAIHLGQSNGRLTSQQAANLHAEVAAAAPAIAQTVVNGSDLARRLAQEWHNANHLVFCGAGPNFGTAMFGAAKILEASGETAVPQDTEEWAHLQYFGKTASTPTILLNANGPDTSRALEIATAAKHIGRRVAVIAPAGSPLVRTPHADAAFTLPPIRECFSPLLTAVPLLLLADASAELLQEPYFRGFGGGRNVEGGGGISRIRSSQQLDEPWSFEVAP